MYMTRFTLQMNSVFFKEPVERVKQRQKLSKAILNATTSRTKLKELQDKCRTAYLDYNDTLNIAIQEAGRR